MAAIVLGTSKIRNCNFLFISSKHFSIISDEIFCYVAVILSDFRETNEIVHVFAFPNLEIEGTTTQKIDKIQH